MQYTPGAAGSAARSASLLRRLNRIQGPKSIRSPESMVVGRCEEPTEQLRVMAYELGNDLLWFQPRDVWCAREWSEAGRPKRKSWPCSTHAQGDGPLLREHASGLKPATPKGNPGPPERSHAGTDKCGAGTRVE
jgi:hypothetical protein